MGCFMVDSKTWMFRILLSDGTHPSNTPVTADGQELAEAGGCRGRRTGLFGAPVLPVPLRCLYTERASREEPLRYRGSLSRQESDDTNGADLLGQDGQDGQDLQDAV